MVAIEWCGCGVMLKRRDGPTHAYMLSTAACWEAYGRLLAREYEEPARWRTHRLSVDAYAVQHPGVDGPQARNSVGVHLSRLGLIYERGWPLEKANGAMLAITAKKFAYPWLTPPEHMGEVTVLDVLATETAEEHMAAVTRWAESIWEAWRMHHAEVKVWLQRI